DCYPMVLRIGGSITKEQTKKIREMAESYCGDCGRFGGEFDGWDEEIGFHGEEPYLRLYLPDAPWGMAEELEEYLKKKKIPFDRYTGPNDGDDGVMVFFRPELSDELIKFQAAEDEVVVSASEVQRAIEQTTGRDDLVARLHELIGGGIPPLPPAQIVDGDDEN